MDPAPIPGISQGTMHTLNVFDLLSNHNSKNTCFESYFRIIIYNYCLLHQHDPDQDITATEDECIKAYCTKG